MSCIALGTLRLNQNGRTPEQALALIQNAVDYGVTTIDTSDVYGGGQAVTLLGQAFALSPGLRSKVEVRPRACAAALTALLLSRAARTVPSDRAPCARRQPECVSRRHRAASRSSRR